MHIFILVEMVYIIYTYKFVWVPCKVPKFQYAKHPFCVGRSVLKRKITFFKCQYDPLCKAKINVAPLGAFCNSQ